MSSHNRLLIPTLDPSKKCSSILVHLIYDRFLTVNFLVDAFEKEIKKRTCMIPLEYDPHYEFDKQTKKCAKVICLFNNKGGVSKTITSANLAFVLAKEGKRVLLFDADDDEQCNITHLLSDKIALHIRADNDDIPNLVPRNQGRYD